MTKTNLELIKKVTHGSFAIAPARVHTYTHTHTHTHTKLIKRYGGPVKSSISTDDAINEHKVPRLLRLLKLLKLMYYQNSNFCTLRQFSTSNSMFAL